jgi:two-component sensor histidine kinase
MAELDHRVKNVLARVAVVATSTREGARSMDEFVRMLDGRIRSMAIAHALLSDSRWRGVSVTNLARSQLAPYTAESNIAITGPDVVLTPAATQAIAIVFHELVTNAAKYGALSAPGGRVSLSWIAQTNRSPPGVLIIEWREMGGPPIAPGTISGYGTTLIRDLIPHELAGTVELTLATDGAFCKLEIPLDLAEVRLKEKPFSDEA